MTVIVDLLALFQETIYLKKDVAHLINIDDKKSKGTYWVSLFIHRNSCTLILLELDTFFSKY